MPREKLERCFIMEKTEKAIFAEVKVDADLKYV